MRIHGFGVLVIIFLTQFAAHANPVAESEPPVQVYMAGETLRVTISPTDAVLRARFVFKSDHMPEKNKPVVVRLPLWFPLNSDRDLTVAEFWATFEKESQNGISTAREKRVFDHAIDLNISAGNRRLVTGHPGFFIAMPANWGPKNHTSPFELRDPHFFEDTPSEEFQSPGYGVLVVIIWSDSDSMLKGKAVTMTYRQPLVYSNGEGHFFYLPVFENMPQNHPTSDTNRYAITLVAAPGCSLTVTSGDKQVHIPNGQSATFGAERHRAIQATVDSADIPARLPASAFSDFYRYKTNFADAEFSRMYSHKLCFFVVRDMPVAGARYVDTPKFPKLGFIKDEPDLVITRLIAVKPDTYTIYRGKTTDEMPVVSLTLRSRDGEEFRDLMRANVNQTILVTLGDKLLAAPQAAPFFDSDNEISWDVAPGDDAQKLVQTLSTLVRHK